MCCQSNFTANLLALLSSTEISDKHRKAEALSEAIDALPHSHFETLKYLLGHLYRSVY